MRIADPHRSRSRRRFWRRGSAAMRPPRSVAARIIADVRRRGDAALFSLDAATGRRAAYARKRCGWARANGAQAPRAGFARAARARWSMPRAIFAAWPRQQRPRSWSIDRGAGRARRPARDAARHHRLLRSGRAFFAGFHAADDGDTGASGRRAAHRGGLPEAESRRCWLPLRCWASRRSRTSAARRRSPRWLTARNRCRAWIKFLARAIATSPRRSVW